MRYTDIAIVGGGLAGSTAAAMLGRASIPVDPHPSASGYRPDFRVEKLSGQHQLERFHKTGLAEAILRSATHDGENWIARFGYLLDKKPSQQFGIMYDALVNAIRAEIPPDVEIIAAKATAIKTSEERQKLTLSNGIEISARLVDGRHRAAEQSPGPFPGHAHVAPLHASTVRRWAPCNHPPVKRPAGFWQWPGRKNARRHRRDLKKYIETPTG